MGKFRNKARRWIGRLAWALIFAGLLLVYEGIFLDFASQLGNVATSTQRSLGMSYSPSPVREMRWIGVDEVRPDGSAALAGLQTGDGVKFDVFLGEDFVWQPGETAAVTVDRDGKRFRAKLTAQKPPPRSPQEESPSFVWLLLALEPLLAGFVTFLLFCGLRNRAAALLGVSMIFWLDPGLAFVPHWAFVALVLFVALPFKAVSLYCWPVFAMEISAGTASMRRARLIRWAAAVLAVAFLVSQLVGILRVPLPFPVPVLFIVTYLADLALGLAIIVRNYRLNDPAGRNRIKIVLSAFGCLFLGIVAAFTLRLLDVAEDAVPWIVLAALTMALGLLAYAVLNKRLFDFGFAINRTLVFGGVTFTLLASFGLLEWSVEHLIPEAWHEGGPYISAAIAVGLFLTFHRVRDWIERHIERLFFSSWHRAEAALRRFVESAGHFDRLPKLCSSFVKALTSYAQGAEAALYLRQRDDAYRLEAGRLAGAKRAYADDDPVFALMRGERRPIDLSHLDGTIPGVLALPMLDQGALTGFVLLGAKHGGADYRPDEVENLGWATHQVGLDLRALHARQLEEQNSRLSAEVVGLSRERDTLKAILTGSSERRPA